jgi:hypothetical protein
MYYSVELELDYVGIDLRIEQKPFEGVELNIQPPYE